MSRTADDGGLRLPLSNVGPYRHVVPSDTTQRGEQFAALIRQARADAGLSQDALADRASINRSTVIRWESGDASRPDPDQVRRVCLVLGIDPRRAAVALGYLTKDEVEGPQLQQLDPAIEEVLDILQDPTVAEDEKRNWITYLRYLRDKGRSQAG